MEIPKRKIWGHTMTLFVNATSSVHYLWIGAGGYCSEHRHSQKENVFFVVRGELKIHWWEGEKQTKQSTILSPRDYFTVPIGVWHQFEATQDTECIEIYNYIYDSIDIERRSVGGIRPTTED